MDLAEHSGFTKIELNPKKSNQKLAFLGERGKPEYPGKNLSQQSREPTNSVHDDGSEIEPLCPIGRRRVLSPVRQSNFAHSSEACKVY